MNLTLNFILKCFISLREAVQKLVVFWRYALTRPVHLNMKTLSISLKFRGHQSSVLTCFLPVTFTVCVCIISKPPAHPIYSWQSRTWLKWLLEDCRLGQVQSIFDIIFHAKDAKLKKNKNLLEINHKKDDCEHIWLCLSRKPWKWMQSG